MEKIRFSFMQAGISENDIEEYGKRLTPEINKIIEVFDRGYDSPYSSINLPFDTAMLENTLNAVKEKTAGRPTILVVIGIGGSNLGAMAVHQALQGKLYNELNQELRVYFADTVDADYIHEIKLLVKQALDRGERIILNVVSKSGSTTETIANFELFLEVLKQKEPKKYMDSIVIATDEGSKLWKYGIEHKIDCLAIPKEVGGRYSVFSPVGLFPLGLLGIDVRTLLDGARDMVEQCKELEIHLNPAALSAMSLYHAYTKGFIIHDTFLFSPDFELTGFWYRQLMAESLGKLKNKAGQEVRAGMTPVVSIGSTDLHSVAQLNIGGPRDKVTSFVHIQKPNNQERLPDWKEFDTLVGHIQNKTFTDLMDAIYQGVLATYKEEKMPYMTIDLPEKNPYYLGQLLQMKMLEVIYLGYLMDVNPFDQPEVEKYKEQTRKLLRS